MSPPRPPPKPAVLLGSRSRDSYFQPLHLSEVKDAGSRYQPGPTKQPLSYSSGNGQRSRLGKLGDEIKRHLPKKPPAQCETDRLCNDCGAIAFREIIGEGNQTNTLDQQSEDTIPPFCKPIEHILEKRNVCNFCGLLYDSLCQEDNDPILHPVVKEFLQDELKRDLEFPRQLSANCQPNRPFKNWAENYWPVFRYGITEGKWPFGTTKDQNEASQAAVNGVLKELIEKTNVEDFDAIANYDGGMNLDTALYGAQAGSLLVGATGIAGKSPGLSAAGANLGNVAQFGSAQLAFSSRNMKNKLTCWVIGVAQKGSSRITIRTFAHGRSPRAPLQLLRQFRLLLEYGTPKVEKNRLRYANKLGPTIDMRFLKQCLQHCQRQHGEQCRVPPHLEPLLSHRQGSIRLIYIPEARLVEYKFSQENIGNLEYVTLSYRWGNVQKSTSPDSSRLYSWNYNELQYVNGVDFSQLPRTIRDAITVTHLLGIDFLWVDSLCVMQDGADEYELMNMGRVYSQSVFTIVAGDGTHSDYGLRGVEPDTERVRICQNLAIGPIVDEKISGYLPLPLAEDVSAWESRAWTLQERLLSRRLLVFSKGFAVWRCSMEVCREDVNAIESNQPDPLPFIHLSKFAHSAYIQHLREDGSDRMFRPRAMQQYCDIVANYSTRSLTKSQDILRALKGLEDVLQGERFLGPFRYGLPMRFLDTALMWIPKGLLHRRDQSEFADERDCPPTWTWAGWKGVTTPSEKQTKGPQIRYERPYTVTTDSTGALLMRFDDTNDERLVTFARFYALMQNQELKEVCTGKPRSESNNVQLSAPAIPPGVELGYQHLLFRARTVHLRLGTHVTRVQQRHTTVSPEHSAATDLTIRVRLLTERDKIEDGSVLSEERLLYLCDDKKQSEAVGTVVMNSIPSDDLVRAIAISAAQYFGTEKHVDVIGYPLLNILLVEKDRGISFRIGLGRMFKYAFDKASPQEETVVLG